MLKNFFQLFLKFLGTIIMIAGINKIARLAGHWIAFARVDSSQHAQNELNTTRGMMLFFAGMGAWLSFNRLLQNIPKTAQVESVLDDNGECLRKLFSEEIEIDDVSTSMEGTVLLEEQFKTQSQKSTKLVCKINNEKELESLLSDGEAMLLEQNSEINQIWESIAELNDYVERYNEMIRNRNAHRGAYNIILRELQGRRGHDNPVYVQTVREQTVALNMHVELIRLKETYPIPRQEDTENTEAVKSFIRDSEEHHIKFKEIAHFFLTQSETFLRQQALLAGEELPSINNFERRFRNV